MPIIVEGQELSPFRFYIEQMDIAIKVFETGRVADVGFPIMSFFSGKEKSQPYADIYSAHIHVFLEDTNMQHVIGLAPRRYIKWVEVIYFYFLEMAAFPTIASSTWYCCWTILDMFERTHSTLSARAQMAGWASVYEKNFATIARDYLKAVRLSTNKEKATRSLILSTTLNKGQADYLDHVKNAIALSSELPHIHKLHAYINYYCQVDDSEDVFTYIISALNWVELEYYRVGKLGLLEPVIWTLQHNKNYRDLLFLLRCLRVDIRKENFKTGHAFLLPNMKNVFIALKPNERIEFALESNGDSYARLMRLCNKLNGVAVSIRGEEKLGSEVKNYDDFAKPSQEGAFENLRQAIVAHYHLENDFYRELSLLTLVPSHNHPVQGALCSLGVRPPLLSTSLQDLTDEASEKHFIFFLASSTYTVELESEWIKGRFGESADIRIDPKPENLLSALNDEQLTHIYISAHGKYDHWEREAEKIHFADNSEVDIQQLRGTRNNWKFRKTLILNLCDGAACRISYNPNNSGMAAALASGSQVVASHLWPVDPKYAATFGLFLLDRLLTGLPCEDAVLNIYKTLSQENSAISKDALKMGEFSEGLSNMIRNTDFQFSDFRNIGAVAIYA